MIGKSKRVPDPRQASAGLGTGEKIEPVSGFPGAPPDGQSQEGDTLNINLF